LVRGHLHVGIELYKSEYFENAKRHMKHPKSELYSALIPTFEAKKAKGFATELANLALSVESNEDFKIISKKYEILLNAISQNEKIVSDENNTFNEKISLANALLEIAAEEYAIGIINGNVENKFEYQDALGFTTIAKNILEETNSLNSLQVSKKNKALGIINDLSSLWPSLVPTGKIKGDAKKILEAINNIKAL
tara:strand:+ start:2477 stop:3061 length:585 start_codon:yes stop_codon:yes gene_type:complete